MGYIASWPVVDFVASLLLGGLVPITMEVDCSAMIQPIAPQGFLDEMSTAEAKKKKNNRHNNVKRS